MNITTIYQEMENRSNLDLSVYLRYLEEHVNSPSFSLSEILNKDSMYMRALGCAALSVKNPQSFFKLITNDSYMPVFTSHMVLIKCSAELLNLNNTNESLEKLLETTIDAVRQCRFNEPGTTLSFAFGFVLGTAIKRGIHVQSFFKKLDSRFIVDNDKLFNGFVSSLNTDSTCLVLNSQYLTDLSDRYDNWEDRSRIVSLSIFKSIKQEKFHSVALVEDNLKVLEYFSGRTTSYNNFLKDYQNKLNTIVLQKTSQEAKKNVMPTSSVQTHSSISEKAQDLPEAIKEHAKLARNMVAQQEEISSLKNQVELYQSIFKQFETLFPDLEKTLQFSDKNLLQKIQQLVDHQKGNLENLQSYYDESEKKKLVKEGIKNRL